MEHPKGFNYNIDFLTEDGTDMTINGVSILENNKLEPYSQKSCDINTDINSNDIINNDNESNDSMGKIVAMTISPSYSKIAFYNNKGIVYIFNYI